MAGWTGCEEVDKQFAMSEGQTNRPVPTRQDVTNTVGGDALQAL